MPSTSVVEYLRELGGIATHGTLTRVCTRGDVDRAVAAGDVVRLSRGRYCLAEVEESARTAARLGGVLCLTSAALRHGWAVKSPPRRPQLMFDRGHRVRVRSEVDVHWGQLGADEVADGATTPEATLAHCMRRLPFDEALAVVDSAMRSGVPRSTLIRIAESARGAGCVQMRRLAAEASPDSANPFESCLRAIALDVPGLSVRPQVTIREPGLKARPDLVDEGLMVVLEADSFQWHGGRAQLRADARRYNLLIVNGWLVLRFAYEDVMFEPDYVRYALVAVVELAEVLKDLRSRRSGAA